MKVFLLTLCCIFFGSVYAVTEINFPLVIVEGQEYQLEISSDEQHLTLLQGAVSHSVLLENQRAKIRLTSLQRETLTLKKGETELATATVTPMPLYLSVIPPLIAILIALFFKEIVSALFGGLFSGTLLCYAYQDSFSFPDLGKSFYAVVDTYLLQALHDTHHLKVILFTMLIGALVHLISKNGGMSGAVRHLSKYARNRRSGQLVVWGLGVLIFFDDYANSLIVGNSMRPITDKLRISREKLAFIVDATAAPIASLAFITTWIGIELSYIQEGIEAVGLEDSAYGVFMKSLDTRFYPFYMLVFVFLLVWTGRDYGAMLKAEKNPERSFKKMSVQQKEEPTEHKLPLQKQRSYNALLPIFIVIAGTILGLCYTGYEASIWSDSTQSFWNKLAQTIGNSDSSLALIWASMTAILVAIVLSVSQKVMSYVDTIESILAGFKSMLTPVLILVFAWALAQMTKDMHTATFISNSLVAIALPSWSFPVATFILAAIVAFATGSSWGTMAILYPLMLPTLWNIGLVEGLEETALISLFYSTVSAILTGAVMGDHCSPISDTTILSATASSCNHLDHVRTQMPYALTVGVVSIFLGYLPEALGMPVWVLYPLGIGTLYLILRKFGKRAQPLNLAMES